MSGPHHRQADHDASQHATAPADALAGRAAPTHPELLARAIAKPKRAQRAAQVEVADQEAYASAVAHARDQAAATQAAVAESRRASSASQPAAAVAASAVATMPVRPRNLTPRAPRVGLRLGDFHVGQAITWEVAVIASVAAWRHSMTVFVPVAIIAVIAVVLTAVRVRDRWLYQWAGVGVRYLFRNRERPLTADETSVLASVARGGCIESIEIDERPIALVTHAGGFTTIVEAVKTLSAEKVAGEVVIPPLDELLPAYEPSEPPVSLQVIVHTVPAPGLLAQDDAVAKSYRELTGGTVPAQRRTWIALQAMHTADAFTAGDMRGALINAGRRVDRKLEKAGLVVDPLRRDEALSEYLGLMSPGGHAAGADVRVQETWHGWRSDDDLHVSFRLVNWPDLASDAGSDLVQRLAAVPASSITVAVSVRRGDESENEIEAAVRIVVPDERFLERAVHELERIAMSAGAQLQRLDGEQVFGVSASIPLGGFAT